MSYRIIISPAAFDMLQGKALTSELQGFRSIRAVGQRYRIVYKVRQETVIVYVVAGDIRRDGDRDDIYSLAKKLFRITSMVQGCSTRC